MAPNERPGFRPTAGSVYAVTMEHEIQLFTPPLNSRAILRGETGYRLIFRPQADVVAGQTLVCGFIVTLRNCNSDSVTEGLFFGCKNQKRRSTSNHSGS